MPHAYAKTLKTFKTASGKEGKFFSLPQLALKVKEELARTN